MGFICYPILFRNYVKLSIALTMCFSCILREGFPERYLKDCVQLDEMRELRHSELLEEEDASSAVAVPRASVRRKHTPHRLTAWMPYRSEWYMW